MAQLFANNAASVLAAGITAGATSFSVASGEGAKFPTISSVDDFFCVTLFQISGSSEANHEIVLVTGRSGDTFTVVRGMEGTTARAFNAADPVQLRVTKGSMDRVQPGARSGLTNLIALSLDRMWRDVYAGGDRPAFMNQQWGGAQCGFELMDALTGQVYKFDVATGNVEDMQPLTIGASIANGSGAFKVSESFTPTEIWLKLYKTGNPTDTFQVQVYSDNGAGSPNAALGSMITLSSKLITSKADGEWYRLAGAWPALVAGTQYHILCSRSGANDVNNVVSVRDTNTSKYPFGGVNAPIGTKYNGAFCFLIPNPASNSFFRSGGQFGGKLVFAEGSPLNQSKALINPLKNFFDPTGATMLHRVSSCVKGKPIADYLYGLDHDRILLMCDAGTGYASIRLWKQDGTLLTVTGNTDVSGAALSDITINFRAMGDGADYLKLFVNGTQQAALTAQTITFDPLMRELGHRWLGGGFPIVTWTQKLDMSSLPSANGWTWTGTATEANCMSVSGGKLYQNKNGYGAVEIGYYSRTTAALNNGTGYAVASKMRVPSSSNSSVHAPASIICLDGTKAWAIYLHEYFIQGVNNGVADGTVQLDLRGNENVVIGSAKGSDYYLFMNGRVIVDSTGKYTQTSATNSIFFGDNDNQSGENADVIYDYVAYTNGGAILPQIATGMALHEYAHWSGDKSSYLQNLYNGGTPVSVKQFASMHRNYAEEVQWSDERIGVTSGPTTSSTTYVQLPDMEAFVVGDVFTVSGGNSDVLSDTVNGYIASQSFVDGSGPTQRQSVYRAAVAQQELPLPILEQKFKTYLGLHKVDIRWYQAGGTVATSGTTKRALTVKGAK